MKTLTANEVDSVVGGGGLDFVNDAARALGGAVAKAVDAVETKINDVGATVKATIINAQFQ
jgi:hypothetical protein